MGDARDLVAQLRRHGVRDVDDSTLTRALYSSDASLYRVVPLVVVRPHDADEVLATLGACRESQVPITARGAGTSIAGNAVGPGAVIDFARHMHRIESVDPEARTAQVQPGVVHASLQALARRSGLRFGPDPSSHSRCTIGGMIGNNACGSRALAYGRTADNVVGLDCVTGGGERLRLGEEPPTPLGSPSMEALRQVVARGLSPIRTELGKFSRQVSGYSLEHLLPERGFDVARSLVGSEGTLSIVLGATVRLVAEPAYRALVILGYPSMADAADDVPGVLTAKPTACEGLDSRIVEVVVRRRGRAAVPPLPPGEGWLLVEVVGASPSQVRHRADRVVASATTRSASIVVDLAHQSALWRIREDGAGLAALALDRPARSGWEDAAVPPARLGAYLREFEALLVERGLHGVPYGHFGEGCLHVRIDFALDRGPAVAAFREFVHDAARLVASHGGSFSGEHGDGRARSELLPLMYSPEVLSLFGDVKRVLDPDGLLNPGVLVDALRVDDDLRLTDRSRVRDRVTLKLLADAGDFSAAVHRCTGVGACVAVTRGPGAVMCPSYVATRDEKDSTRGRARVLQDLVGGEFGGAEGRPAWRSSEVHDALDLCLACKGCATDCPTGVDLATYKSEVLHQSYRRRLRPRGHYTLGWLPRWAALASRVPRAVNLGLRLPPTARLARWVAGVDPRRPLPAFAQPTFRAWARRRPPARDAGARVVVWADSFTDYFSPGVGRAAVEVLEAAGYRVEVPDEQLCCGLTWFATGQLDAAARILGRTVTALTRYVDQGVSVVGLEPSCTAMLRADSRELLDDPRAQRLADGVVTLAELLSATPGWQPPDLAGTHLVAQPHCHHASVLGWGPDRALLEATGAELMSVGGCCGLAGSFGVERGHHDVSLAIAEHELLPAVRAAGEQAVVLADGFSCRTQLDQLANRSSIHLAELLAAHGHGPPQVE